MGLGHNARVFWVVRLLCILFVAVMAGCATAPRADYARPPADPVVESPTPVLSETVVSAEAILAPPPEHAPITPAIPVPAAPPVTNPPPVVTRNMPPVAVPIVEAWVPLAKWCGAKGLSGLTRQTGTPHPTYQIQLPQGLLVLHVGSLHATFNGVQIRLGFAPQMISGQPFVHSLDLAKTVEPLQRLADIPAGFGGAVILLDPGHGGPDAGAASVLRGHSEKDFALDWALRLRSLLVAQGWQVHLTRTNDVEVPVAVRAQMAESLRASLFVSLHLNSAGVNRTESGVETYCLTPARMPSSLTRGYPDDLRASFPNNLFDVQNLQLAVRVHRALTSIPGTTDRGVRRARFLGVLRPQQRPAILVEGGYLSQPAEARLIATTAHRQKLAEAVARGIGTPRQQIAEIPH